MKASDVPRGVAPWQVPPMVMGPRPGFVHSHHPTIGMPTHACAGVRLLHVHGGCIYTFTPRLCGVVSRGSCMIRLIVCYLCLAFSLKVSVGGCRSNPVAHRIAAAGAAGTRGAEGGAAVVSARWGAVLD